MWLKPSVDISNAVNCLKRTLIQNTMAAITEHLKEWTQKSEH